jgi:hypothetical protein
MTDKVLAFVLEGHRLASIASDKDAKHLDWRKRCERAVQRLSALK